MIIFVILANVVLLLFIIGLVLFVLQYRRRKKDHEKEKALIHEQHKGELLDAHLEIQTRTMRHIGREIHDSVGQKLTLASLYVSQVVHRHGDDAIVDRVSSIGQIINESLEELRSLSKTLTSQLPVQASLTALLAAERKYVNASGACTVVLHSNETPGLLSPAVINLLYRILQEFIQNSLKHAACKQISIRVQSLENGWEVEAADDGQGFDIGQPSTGIGLNNMRQRAEQACVSYALYSEPGKGTRLLLQSTNNKQSA